MKHYGDKHAKFGHILQLSASNNMLMFPEAHPEVGCIVHCQGWKRVCYFPKSTQASTDFAPGKCLLFRC